MAARVREKSNGRVRDRVRRERPRGERKEEKVAGLGRKERGREWRVRSLLSHNRRSGESKEEKRSGATSPRSKGAAGTVNLHDCHHFSPPSSPADLHRGILVQNSC